MKKKFINYGILLLLFLSSFNFLKAQEIKMSVAASMKGVMEKITEEYKRENPNVEFLINYGSSGILRKQIESGAGIDIVFFADTENMERLKKQSLISDEKSGLTIYNSLVFVGNKEIKSIDEIKNEKIGIGDPKTVPVGKYAMEYLNSQGYTDKLKENLIFAKDVASVTNYLEIGEIDFAIIYKTELSKLKKGRLLFEIDDTTHSEIEYSFGIVKGRENETVNSFYRFLSTDKVKTILKESGYNIK